MFPKLSPAVRASYGAPLRSFFGGPDILDTPKRPPGCPRRLQEAPRRRQEGPRRRFWRNFRRFWRILEDFGRFFGTKLTPKTDQKSISALKTKNQLNASRLTFSWFVALIAKNEFQSDFGANLPSLWTQKTIGIASWRPLGAS